ncbi:MAG: T9SS type A sorting domain-containing protein [Flavobacteriales bacterium]|nr:T9SS type A sorting domain-containing protein [Flavobacteriales bacterium]
MSDFGLNQLLEIDVSDLDNPSYTVVVEDTGSKPNGVVYDETNDRIIFCSWGSNANIVAVDPSSYEMTTLTSTGLTNCDGIDNDGANNFFVSSWSPTRITKYNEDFSVSEIVTAPGLDNPADISYAQAIDTLAVANSGNETLTLVGFDTSTELQELSRDNGMIIYPNPVSQESVIAFNLDHGGRTVLTVRDASGKLVYEFLNEDLLPGKHQVLLAGIHLESGYYICDMQSEGSFLQFPFLAR